MSEHHLNYRIMELCFFCLVLRVSVVTKHAEQDQSTWITKISMPWAGKSLKLSRIPIMEPAGNGDF